MVIARHYDEAVKQVGSPDRMTMTELLRVIKQIKDGEGVPAEAGSTAESNNEPEAAFVLPSGGYEYKRQELDRLRAEGALAVEENEKLTHFIDARLEALYAAVRRYAHKELSALVKDSGVDAAQLAILLIDRIKSRLSAEKLFLKPAGDNEAGNGGQDSVLVNRIKQHLSRSPALAATT
ncbi:MAG TPA: hypothetical protein VFA26_11975 [Gemmataceae bacterium]|nr:hypothetical protein [Gemmataceae bacterium]